jgi:uncharacterized protein YceH (UPF0502 family)
MSSSETRGDGGEAKVLPPLDPTEARILGCLIEKQATTPEQYPLTENAVVVACNQKTNREPVMELQAGEVGHALRELVDRGLARVVDGARARRYEHRFASSYSVTTKQQSVLAALLLRGPQTLSELHARTERLASFADADEVRETLDRLVQRTPTLVVNLGRGPGQREDRWMHLLCGPVSAGDFAAASDDVPAAKRGALEARVEALEAEVQALRREIEALRDR